MPLGELPTGPEFTSLDDKLVALGGTDASGKAVETG